MQISENVHTYMLTSAKRREVKPRALVSLIADGCFIKILVTAVICPILDA